MTFTRLTLGEPRLRGRPKGGPVEQPCDEPLVYGANILRDPGFESHLSTYVEGPDGEHFPGEWGNEAISFPLWADATPVSEAALDGTGWGVFSNNGSSPTNRWLISTSNPRSGTYHARFDWDISLGGGEDTSSIDPLGVTLCEGAGAASARVEAGDFVELSGYAAISNLVDGMVSVTRISFHREDLSKISDSNTGVVAFTTTAYTLMSHNAVAPVDSHYAQCTFDIFPPSSMTTDVVIDLDDAVLEVQP